MPHAPRRVRTTVTTVSPSPPFEDLFNLVMELAQHFRDVDRPLPHSIVAVILVADRDFGDGLSSTCSSQRSRRTSRRSSPSHELHTISTFSRDIEAKRVPHRRHGATAAGSEREAEAIERWRACGRHRECELQGRPFARSR